jgi:hypothetical protein
LIETIHSDSIDDTTYKTCTICVLPQLCIEPEETPQKTIELARVMPSIIET